MVPAEPALLAVSGLTAGYRNTPIIRNVTLTVQRGECLAILGANGSGKSTLMRALSGQISTLAGQIQIGGVDLARAPATAKRGFGYAVDPADLPGDLTGHQYLEMIGSIRGCSACGGSADLIEQLQFGPWLHQTIDRYSLGTRMKLSFVSALLGTPPLLLLDEALNGLDPLILARTRKILADLCIAGHGVVMSTHLLGTIGPACTAVLMLEGGKITHHWPAPTSTTPSTFETMIVATLEADASCRST